MPGAKRGGRSEERVAAALTGAGPSVLGVDGAMRARDISQPTPADDAVAERLVQVSFRPRFTVPPGAAADQPGSAGSSPDAS